MLIGADGHATTIWSGNGYRAVGLAVGDNHGVWFVIANSDGLPGHEGLYLWTPHTGAKLIAALDHFGFSAGGLVALDIGASTGGFTDVLLRRGAARVVAVDVGHGQLDWRLRNDPRVHVLERINARALDPAQLPADARLFSLAVMDVSFISVRQVLPAIVPLLVRALRELGRGTVGETDAEQRESLEHALAAAAGVAIDGFVDDGIVIPGERLEVEATVWNAGAGGVTLDGIDVTAPPGWKVERLDAATSPVPQGALATRRFAVTVAPDAPRSQPYFLRHPLAGGLYDWTGTPADWRGLPFEPSLVEMAARLTIAGQPVTLRREVVYRYRDQGIGEVRRPIVVTTDETWE